MLIKNFQLHQGPKEFILDEKRQNHVTNKPNIQKLQRAQNSIARIATGTRRSEHITPVLARLHWLKIAERIENKVALLRDSVWEQSCTTATAMFLFLLISTASSFVSLTVSVSQKQHSGYVL